MRRLAILLPLCLLTLAPPGCSERAPQARYAVVQRSFAWERYRSGSPPKPLSLSWTFEQGDAGWLLADGRMPEAQSGQLLGRGLDRVGFRSPEEARLDADVHHWLNFRAATREVESVRIRWRAADESFSDARSTSPQVLSGASDDEASDGHVGDAGWGRSVNYSIPIDSLRGLRDAKDAAEGLAQIELLFEGSPGSRPEVRLDEVHLSSDFDRQDGSEHRLGRDGVYRTGVTLRAPGSLSCMLHPGPRDRLVLALALAGGDGPATVRLSLPDTGAEPVQLLLTPGAEWLETELDMSPAGGEPSRVEVSLEQGNGLLMLGSVLRLAPGHKPRPDVLLYLEDTLRADRLGTYGYAYDTDPQLKRMAAEGVVFGRAYGASNWTRPSVSTLLTSLDPLTHGNVTHLDRVADDWTTLAEALAQAGYQTRSFVTNYHGGAWSGLDQGFDVAAEPPAWGASRVVSTETSSVITPPLSALLAAHPDELLFVYVHTLDPHRPYQPDMDQLYPLLASASSRPLVPGGKTKNDESLRYDAEIRHNDDQLALLDAALQRSGRAGHTLSVFLADHGEAFGEHGQFEHRESLHVEELHVPLVLRWPRVLAPGHRIDLPVGLADVSPTLLGLVGIATPDNWQGRDLSPRLLALDDTGGAHPGAGPPQGATAGQASSRDAAPVLVHTEYDKPRDGLLQEVAVIGERYKLVAGLPESGPLVPRALYDLGDDPGEAHDLLDDPALAATLAALTAFAQQRVEQDRLRAHPAEATQMDPAQKRWMIEMGYLGR